jgi:hypothetical protein
MANLPVGARVNISPRGLARSEPVAAARPWTACAGGERSPKWENTRRRLTDERSPLGGGLKRYQ